MLIGKRKQNSNFNAQTSITVRLFHFNGPNTKPRQIFVVIFPNPEPTTFLQQNDEKTGPGQIQTQDFVVPDVLVTSGPSMPKTRRNLNLK